MKTIQQILILTSLSKEDKNRVNQLLPNTTILYRTNQNVTKEEIDASDIILGNPPLSLLSPNEKLQLLCLQSAGSDNYSKQGVLADTTILTNATGSYGGIISEYMMSGLLMMYQNLDQYYINKTQSIWKEAGYSKSIQGRKTLIVGLGDIGGEFAKKIKAFGGYTIGIRRTLRDKPEYLDELTTLDTLDDYLPQVDIVALSLPQSNETINLFNKQRISKMKKDAVLINVGRGTAIVLDDLIELMQQGHLFAGILDVTNPEPLPSSHPAWNIDNLFITPHISGISEVSLNTSVSIILNNLEAFLYNKELRNVVDKSTGYRKL